MAIVLLLDEVEEIDHMVVL